MGYNFPSKVLTTDDSANKTKVSIDEIIENTDYFKDPYSNNDENAIVKEEQDCSLDSGEEGKVYIEYNNPKFIIKYCDQEGGVIEKKIIIE
jgi:uncharacterized protein (DUF302 family)